MAEMIECPNCGVDTIMEQARDADGRQGWRCPDCGQIVAPGMTPKDEQIERAVHVPAGGRSEDD